MFRALLATSLLFSAVIADAQVTLTRGTNFSIDVAADGRVAFDLLGQIWVIPDGGGVAQAVPGAPSAARRPRWSPGSNEIVFQARDGGQEQLWLYRFDGGSVEKLTVGQFFDHQPAWHPQGDRIVYSSDRKDSGFDLWEYDIATGLTWRVSSLPGDETEPAWSSDGEDLVYIHRQNGQWNLVLRRRGEPERVLESSTVRLSSPSWRPDGSLITFLRHGEDELLVEMVILSEPLLIRPLLENEDFFVTPVAWRDRQTMLYAANGLIRKREFNSWTSRNLPFRATVYRDATPRRVAPGPRDLPVTNAPDQKLVVRASRLFDGIGGGYRHDMDIIMEGGRITAVEPRADRPGAIVVDMGDLTVLPGLIDGHARLTGDIEPSLGPILLSFGLTAVVVERDDADELNATWSTKEMPGPLVLGKDWIPDLDTMSAMNLSVESLPTSPRGIRYEDARLENVADPASVISGLADARTPGLTALLRSRQARLLRGFPTALRRYSEAPQIAAQSSSIVLGSQANGLPPGLGLHAELLALSGAGLDTQHVLRTAGINAAKVLGLGLQTGRIAPGASADLVLVDGDPLDDIGETLKIVGVVRNGRFFSTIGLIERAQ